MKIYIIGPSGSGKTYLATKLSKSLNHKHINLDYVFFKHIKDKSRIEVPETIWKKEISSIIKEENWIIEGVNPINKVLITANKIIYLKPKLASALYNQWHRYVSDPKQRKEHGFVNNLKLSNYLIKQYLQNPDLKEINNPKYSRIKKTDLILKPFSTKTTILKTRQEVDNFIKTFLN